MLKHRRNGGPQTPLGEPWLVHKARSFRQQLSGIKLPWARYQWSPLLAKRLVPGLRPTLMVFSNRFEFDVADDHLIKPLDTEYCPCLFQAIGHIDGQVSGDSDQVRIVLHLRYTIRHADSFLSQIGQQLKPLKRSLR